MTVSLRRLVVAVAVAGLCGGLAALPNTAAGAAQRPRAKKPAKPAPPRKAPAKPASPAAPAANAHLDAGDLKVDVRSVQRSPRLIGDLARSRDDDYLVIRLHVETPPGKTADVPIRATFALLSASTPPVKYPTFSMGYFQPAGARPAVGTEAVRVSSGGADFSIAAEAPKSEKQFRLVVQKPVAEVTIGRPQSLPSTARVNALGGSVWEGQVTRIDTDTVVYRVNPGSTGLDLLRPHNHVFVSMLLELRNASSEPQAVTAADIVAVSADQRESGPLGVMGDRGKTAAPIPESRAVTSQVSAPPLHPVWDLLRSEPYTVQIYAAAAQVPLPPAAPAGEIAVDTAKGHLIAGREQHLAGELQKAIGQYQLVIKNFPGSDEEDEARARLADAQVALVLKQPYMALPPVQAQGRGVAGQQVALEVEDAANLPLTLYFSGPNSQVVEVQPNEKREITLAQGSYKVVATGKDPHLRPFAGEWGLQAGTRYIVSFIVVRVGGQGQ